MDPRQAHRPEVEDYVNEYFAARHWTLTLPPGSGSETYIARGGERPLFVKLGASIETARAMAQAGLSPRVLAADVLPISGLPILITEYIEGRTPNRHDWLPYLEQVADIVRRMHTDEGVKRALRPTRSDSFSEAYGEAALSALGELRGLVRRYKSQDPEAAPRLLERLDELHAEATRLEGGGLAASHNDICNANWLIAPDGRLYLVDLDAMALDDPARDVGVLLWWYYPPESRRRFLELAGYADDPGFEERMRVRTAMHLLLICFPRLGSFDTFDPARFKERLRDFEAAIAGEENPEGYWV